MSARAEELATRFEQANQSVIDLIERDADLSVTCPSEGWTAAALGAHVGGGHFGIVEYLVKPILAGQDFGSFDAKSLDEGNAKAAAENATIPKDEILTLLREHGESAAAFLRTLTDEDLDRTTTMATMGPGTGHRAAGDRDGPHRPPPRSRQQLAPGSRARQPRARHARCARVGAPLPDQRHSEGREPRFPALIAPFLSVR